MNNVKSTSQKILFPKGLEIEMDTKGKNTLILFCVSIQISRKLHHKRQKMQTQICVLNKSFPILWNNFNIVIQTINLQTWLQQMARESVIYPSTACNGRRRTVVHSQIVEVEFITTSWLLYSPS